MLTFLKAGTVIVLMLMGIMAGVFFAFSSFAMPGLDQIDAKVAIQAMQGMNGAVRNASFFVPFFLTPVICFTLALIAWRVRNRKAAQFLLWGGAVYLVGGMFLTMVYHVPMNEALAFVDVAQLEDQAATIWAEYSSAWTPWNTFRTGVCLAAMIPLSLALRKLAPQDTIA